MKFTEKCMECFWLWYPRPRRTNVTYFHAFVDVWFWIVRVCASFGMSLEVQHLIRMFIEGFQLRVDTMQIKKGKQVTIKCEGILELHGEVRVEDGILRGIKTLRNFCKKLYINYYHRSFLKSPLSPIYVTIIKVLKYLRSI